jgi:hypothetical protein
MESLRQTALKRGIEIPKKEDGSYTVADVLKVVGEVQKEHSAPTGNVGKIRDFFRGVGREAPAMQQWIQFFPQDAYGSALCGGFTIILSV